MPAKKAKKKASVEQSAAKKHDIANIWQERVAELLFILLMCMQPLYLSEDRYIGLTGQKFWFFFWCMCLIIMCGVAVWVYRIGREPWILPEDKLFVADWAVLGFAVITIVAALLSPYKDDVNVWVGIEEPGGRYDGAITQTMYAAAFLVIAKWYRPRRRDFVIFGISVIVISLLGIFQFFGMDFFKLYPNHIPAYATESYDTLSYYTTLGNINIVSTYACVSVLLCGAMYIKMDSKWRILWLAGSALGAWLMIVARSDSGVVGTVVAASVALPFVARDAKELGRLLILISSCLFTFTVHRFIYYVSMLHSMTAGSLLPYLAATAILLTLGLVSAKSGKQADPDTPVNLKPRILALAGIIIGGIACIEIAGRSESLTMIYQIREIMHGRFEDHYVSDRIFIWRYAFMAFPNRPILGTGPDTFRYAISPEAHELFGVILDKAHNEYVQILICQGILGAVGYFVFLGGVLIKAIPNALKNPLLMAIAVAFAGYCVQAFFNISLPIVSQMMWVLAGVLAGQTKGRIVF